MDRYEEIEQRLSQKPRVSLGFFPTPLQRLERLSEELGVELYIKRDDFTGISLFGGNKIRKLEYLLGDAVEKGCDTLITFGATQSNHAMQTATAARKCGLYPILYLMAIVEPKPEDVRANLLLDQILGAEVHIVPTKGKTIEEAMAECRRLAEGRKKERERAGHRCYEVPVGGATDIGSAGFIGGYTELCRQMENLGIQADYIVTASGSGGTAAGLAAGIAAAGDPVQLISMATFTIEEGYEDTIADLASGALRYIGLETKVRAADILAERAYQAPGYEIPSEQANEAIRRLARTEGILTDPVYSGKAFGGLLDYIEKGKIPKGSTVAFWHTGGATALFAEPEIIGSLAER